MKYNNFKCFFVSYIAADYWRIKESTRTVKTKLMIPPDRLAYRLLTRLRKSKKRTYNALEIALQYLWVGFRVKCETV